MSPAGPVPALSGGDVRFLSQTLAHAFQCGAKERPPTRFASIFKRCGDQASALLRALEATTLSGAREKVLGADFGRNIGTVLERRRHVNAN